MKRKLNQTQINKIANAIKNTDKDKLTLMRRKRYGKQIYHLSDSSNPKKQVLYSLMTEDKGIAHTLFSQLTSKVELEESELGVSVAVSLAKMGKETRKRTWDDSFKACCYEGLSEVTLVRMKSHWKQPHFDELRNQPIIGTSRPQIQRIYKAGKISTQRMLGQLIQRANDEGWCVDAKLLTKIDREQNGKAVGGNTAAMTDEIHYGILNAMEYAQDNWKPYQSKGDTIAPSNRWRDKATHGEVCSWLKLLWLMGASNLDARTLKVENINWNTGHVVFKRAKWTKRNGKDRLRQSINWPMCEELKELIRPLYNKAEADKRGEGYLLPLIAHTPSSYMMDYFKNYAKIAGVKLKVKEDGELRKIVIHSYRYRMAQRLFESGYEEREAMSLLGHKSGAVHHAYAKGAKLKIKPIDQQRKDVGLDKIVAVDKAA